MKLKKINPNFMTWLLFICVGSVMLFLNFMTPLIADDYGLAKNGISDVIHESYNMYCTWTGRVFAHFLAMIFLLLNKAIFNVANTLMYLLFVGLCCFHASYGLKMGIYKKVLCFLLINLLLFIYVPDWGQIFLWLAGACNYLWTSTFILLYLVLYRKSLVESKLSNSKYLILLVFILGSLAGWCNENNSCGAIIFVGIAICTLIYQKKKIPIWMYSGLLGATFTFIIMVKAPGNAVRITKYHDTGKWYILLIKRFGSITAKYYSNFRYLLFALVIVAIILIWLSIKGKLKKDILIIPFIYSFISLVMGYVLVLSPYSPNRSFFGCATFLIIGLISGLLIIMDTVPESIVIIGCYTSVLMLIMLVNFCGGLIDIAQYKLHSDRRSQYIIEQKEKGMSNIIVNEITPGASTKYNGAFQVIDRPNSIYYGVESIGVVPNEVFEKVFRNGNIRLIDCRDFFEYISLIDNPQYLVIMTMNGNSLNMVQRNITEAIKKLKLNVDFGGNTKNSYLAVINKGKVVEESSSDQSLYFSDIINEHSIIVESCWQNSKNYFSSVKIDGYDYVQNIIGLNIVVFDIEQNKVIDRVTFDIYGGMGAIR